MAWESARSTLKHIPTSLRRRRPLGNREVKFDHCAASEDGDTARAGQDRDSAEDDGQDGVHHHMHERAARLAPTLFHRRQFRECLGTFDADDKGRETKADGDRTNANRSNVHGRIFERYACIVNASLSGCRTALGSNGIFSRRVWLTFQRRPKQPANAHQNATTVANRTMGAQPRLADSRAFQPNKAVRFIRLLCVGSTESPTTNPST